MVCVCGWPSAFFNVSTYGVEGGEGGIESGPDGEEVVEGPGEEEADVKRGRPRGDHPQGVLHAHEEKKGEGEGAGYGVPPGNGRGLPHGPCPRER